MVVDGTPTRGRRHISGWDGEGGSRRGTDTGKETTGVPWVRGPIPCLIFTTTIVTLLCLLGNLRFTYVLIDLTSLEINTCRMYETKGGVFTCRPRKMVSIKNFQN